MMIQIGYLSAHIPGDFRYNDVLKVMYDTEQDCCVCRVESSTASGDMDSFDTLSTYGTKDMCTGAMPTGAVLVKLIKTVMGNSEYLFKRYGKPSKSFKWLLTKKVGLSAALAQETLHIARQLVLG